MARSAAALASVAALFVVATSVSGGWIEGAWARAAAGAVAVAVPLLVRARLGRVVRRRGRARPAGFLAATPRLGPWFLVACNAALVLVICLGFSTAVGRSLRRRGDWFLGELDGPLPRRYRALLVVVSAWLERYDLPPEAQPLLVEAAQEPRLARPLAGGTQPPPAPAASPWRHPLLGPRRALPPNAACRFGAPRPGPRPPECELGHCGIDLVQPEGSPVLAVSDGVVLQAQRDAVAGGIAGRFVVIAHRGGAIRSYYVHLQEIRSDLRPGTSVRASELLGTLGRTGTRRSGPHLHFALAVQRASGLLYIDPEPLVRGWSLPSAWSGPGPLLSRASPSVAVSKASHAAAARANRHGLHLHGLPPAYWLL